MTEIDGALVRRKLLRIIENLHDLESVERIELSDYVIDRFRKKGTEKMLQETVEAAVDANLHLLSAAGLATPADYYTSFIEAGRHGIIPTALAERLAPSTGLRNRLVHEYDALDDGQILSAIRHAVADYREYVGKVEDWLTQRGI
jgi:uncharacterized protein YutE (UPF0331/DUF86 family)